MSLLDRIAHNPPYDVVGGISAASFGAALFEMHRGTYSKVQVMSAFGLIGGTDDETEFDFIIGLYQAHADKERFISDLVKILFLVSDRKFNYTNKATLLARLQAI